MNALIVFILASTLCLISAEQTTTPDYRDKYDHIWLEWLNERIREGEQYLERLSHKYREWQSTHNEDLRNQMESEVEAVLADVKTSLTRMDGELKKSGLNLIERYSLEKAKSGANIVIKLLTEVQKQITKKP